MNLRTITLLAIALTLYLVGSTALKLIASLLPIPIPVECILIGLFMGMFPRKTAMIFYAVTCGLLIVETIVNIPYLIIAMQTTVNISSALALNPIEVSPIMGNYSGALWIVVIVSTITVLAKYKMRAIEAFFEIILNTMLIIIYALVPLGVFTLIVVWLSGVTTKSAIENVLILSVYVLVTWDIYITVTGPFVARWLFRRIGIYKRIPKIWQG